MPAGRTQRRAVARSLSLLSGRPSSSLRRRDRAAGAAAVQRPMTSMAHSKYSMGPIDYTESRTCPCTMWTCRDEIDYIGATPTAREALTLLNSLLGSSMLRASLVSQSATAVSAKSLGTVLYGRDRRLYRRMGGRTADVRVNIITNNSVMHPW